jgi:hypothetical protein
MFFKILKTKYIDATAGTDGLGGGGGGGQGQNANVGFKGGAGIVIVRFASFI